MRAHPFPYRRNGFSLVELSVVLVIIGLLVGGILAGKSVMRNAQLRAVTSEYARHRTAVSAFRLKYSAIPGDMSNATDYWARSSTTSCASYASAAVGSPGTCDGNGDGIVAGGTAGASAEYFQFWRQLALGGFIEGAYTGYAGSGSSARAVFGTNAPASKLKNAGWSAHSTINYAGDSMSFKLDYGSGLLLGAETTSWAIGYVLTPREAWNIDSKLDDGLPGAGGVVVYNWPQCSTASSFSDYAASYRISEPGTVCAFYFPRQW